MNRKVEGDRGGREPERIRTGMWAGSRRTRNEMRESCEGGRQKKNEEH